MLDEKLRRLVLDAAEDKGTDWAIYDRKDDEELDAPALARALATGAVTHEEVLEAFAKGAGLDARVRS